MTDKTRSYKRRETQVFEGIEYGPKPLLTVTDAELVALRDPDILRMAPLPTLGPTVSQQQRDAAVRAAADRLLGTGIAEDGTALGGSSSSAPEPTVRTVLRMRDSWVCRLLVEQVTGDGRQWIALYLRNDRRALSEVITGDGRHKFTAMKRAAALDSVAALLTPFEDAADHDAAGRDHAVDEWEQAEAETIAWAKVASTVIAKQRTPTADAHDAWLVVYNFDDRTELLTRSGDRVRIAPVARRTLRHRFGALTGLERGSS